MDEFVKRLREVADEVDNDYDVDPYNAEQRCLAILQAADVIEGLSHAVDQMTEWRKNPWIPVTERLPDVFKHVLVNIPGMAPHSTVQEAFREKNGMWYSNGFRYEADEITHWMPLPEPPTAEEDE